MSVTITSAPAAARPRAIAAPLPRPAPVTSARRPEQHVLHGRRLLQRLADHRLVADMVDQQQDQPRVEGAALLVAQALMGVDDGVVDVVGLREVERASQRAFHCLLLLPGRPRAAPPATAAAIVAAASAPRHSGPAGSDRSCRAARRSAWPASPLPSIATSGHAGRRGPTASPNISRVKSRPQPVDQPAVARAAHRPSPGPAPARPTSRRRRRACRAASRPARSAPTAGRC